MKALSEEQRDLLDRLLFLADGQLSLVEEALRSAGEEPGEPPTLDEVVAYILNRTNQSGANLPDTDQLNPKRPNQEDPEHALR